MIDCNINTTIMGYIFGSKHIDHIVTMRCHGARMLWRFAAKMSQGVAAHLRLGLDDGYGPMGQSLNSHVHKKHVSIDTCKYSVNIHDLS